MTELLKHIWKERKIKILFFWNSESKRKARVYFDLKISPFNAEWTIWNLVYKA